MPFQHAVEHNSGTNSNTGRPTIYVTKGKSLYEWNEWFKNKNAGIVNALGDRVFLLGIRIYFSNNMCVVGFRVQYGSKDYNLVTRNAQTSTW